MDFFKFSLTDEQVRLLHQILEDAYSRGCNLVWVKRNLLKSMRSVFGNEIVVIFKYC